MVGRTEPVSAEGSPSAIRTNSPGARLTRIVNFPGPDLVGNRRRAYLQRFAQPARERRPATAERDGPILLSTAALARVTQRVTFRLRRNRPGARDGP